MAFLIYSNLGFSHISIILPVLDEETLYPYYILAILKSIPEYKTLISSPHQPVSEIVSPLKTILATSLHYMTYGDNEQKVGQ